MFKLPRFCLDLDKDMRTGKVSHPVAHRFVDRVLQGFRAENDGNDLWNLNHALDVLGGAARTGTERVRA